jgi:hypothetical protein
VTMTLWTLYMTVTIGFLVDLQWIDQRHILLKAYNDDCLKVAVFDFLSYVTASNTVFDRMKNAKLRYTSLSAKTPTTDRANEEFSVMSFISNS